MKRDRTRRVSASDSLFSVSEVSNSFSSRGGSFMSLLLPKVTMRGAGETAKKKSGGYNVAWLILVQAVVWNILYPVYLMTNGYVFLVLVSVYIAALMVVAKKDTEPRNVTLAQYQKIPTEFKGRVAEFKTNLKPAQSSTRLKSNPLQT